MKKDNISPAFQFYPNDWLSSPKIMTMSPAEEGAYIRLLCICWANDGLPDNDDELAVLSRLGEDWLNGRSTAVRKCFIKHPKKNNFLHNKRLMTEAKKQHSYRQAGRKAGIASGKARRKKNLGLKEKMNEPSTTVAKSLNGLRTKSNSSSSSSSSSSDLKEKNKKSARANIKFIKPAPQEVEEYATQIGASIDGQMFCSYYEANGWRVGRNPMKSWKAAVVTWTKRSEFNKRGDETSEQQAQREMDEYRKKRKRQGVEVP